MQPAEQAADIDERRRVLGVGGAPGPLGPGAGGIQPAGHSPGDPPAGPAPRPGNGTVLQPAPVLRPGDRGLYQSGSDWVEGGC